MKHYIYPAIPFFKELSCPKYLKQAFRFFLSPFNLIEIRTFFQDPVIADISRNKYHIFAGAFFICINQDGKESQFGQNQFAGSTASSLYEEFDVETFFQKFLNIF